MFARITLALFVLPFAIAAAGCSMTGSSTPPVPPATQPGTPPSDPASGSRLAPGLYDLDDGTVQAVGTLEWVDLEGGFWAIRGGTDAEGDTGRTVAVIGDPGGLEADLKALQGKTVLAKGTRLEGASIRMAGPEIALTAVEEVSDTPGPAE